MEQKKKKKKQQRENKQTSIYMRNGELALALFTSIYAVFFVMSSTKTMFETKNISDKNKQKPFKVQPYRNNTSIAV